MSRRCAGEVGRISHQWLSTSSGSFFAGRRVHRPARVSGPVLGSRHVRTLPPGRGTILRVSDSLLGSLVGEQLGSVVFVMDYLQLDFSAARFSTYVWPTVTVGDVTSDFGDPGYRDALCAFITHEVLSVEESRESGLVIRFGLGEIATNPAPTDLSGPEIAQLHVYEDSFRDAALMVWRPGEDVFAGRDWS